MYVFWNGEESIVLPGPILHFGVCWRKGSMVHLKITTSMILGWTYSFFRAFLFSIPHQKSITTRWANTSYERVSNHYKWPYKWVTGVITPMSRVMGPYLQLVLLGPPCRWFQRVSHVYPLPDAMIQMSVKYVSQTGWNHQVDTFLSIFTADALVEKRRKGSDESTELFFVHQKSIGESDGYAERSYNETLGVSFLKSTHRWFRKSLDGSMGPVYLDVSGS